MRSRRFTARALGLVSLLLLPALSTESQARPISTDNSVDVAWTNDNCAPALNFFACGSDVQVLGGLQLITNAKATDGLQIDISFFTDTREIESLDLFLEVATPNMEVVTIGSNELQLTYLNFASNYIGLNTDPITGFIEPVTLHLSDFAGYANLPTGDLVFRLTGKLNGYSGFGACPDPGYVRVDANNDHIPDIACEGKGEASTVPAALITMSGGRDVSPTPGPPTTTVPEPSSLALLLVGGFSVAGIRRRR